MKQSGRKVGINYFEAEIKGFATSRKLNPTISRLGRYRKVVFISAPILVIIWEPAQLTSCALSIEHKHFHSAGHTTSLLFKKLKYNSHFSVQDSLLLINALNDQTLFIMYLISALDTAQLSSFFLIWSLCDAIHMTSASLLFHASTFSIYTRSWLSAIPIAFVILLSCRWQKCFAFLHIQINPQAPAVDRSARKNMKLDFMSHLVRSQGLEAGRAR